MHLLIAHADLHSEETGMDSKIMILGLGSVGRSLMNILLTERLFPPENILATDCSDASLEYFLSVGGKKENFMQYEMNSTNYKRVFDHLHEGDRVLGRQRVAVERRERPMYAEHGRNPYSDVQVGGSLVYAELLQFFH